MRISPLLMERLSMMPVASLTHVFNYVTAPDEDRYFSTRFASSAKLIELGFENDYFAFERTEYVTWPDKPTGKFYEGVVITDKGKDFMREDGPFDLFPEMSVDTLASYEDQAIARTKIALWHYLMKNGSTYSYYGNYVDKKEAPKEDMIHLFLCGLDFGKSSLPTIDTWDEFDHTFTETSLEGKGLIGRAVCLCGDIDEYSDNAILVPNMDLQDILRIQFSYA